MTLAVLFVLAELADLATYLQAPHLESNPAMQGWPPVVVAAKFLGVTAIAALALVGLTGRKQTFTLGACLAVAAFSFGTNAHALTAVAASESPRPALLVIPAVPKGPSPSTGVTTTTTSGTDAGRTPASRPYGAVEAPDLRGRASWYSTSGSIAAAGPALRRALGPGWRGTWIRVSAGGRAVVVRLDDWCQCYRGEARERLIDLSDDDFAVLAPLPVGVLRVTVSTIAPPATDR